MGPKHLTHIIFVLLLGLAFNQAYSQGASPCPTQALASTTNVIPARSPALVCLLPQVFGPGGLVGINNGGPLDSTTGHEAHFQSSSVRSFTPLNEEIGVELNAVPLAAPVAGYIFANGGLTATAQSLGPILSDRADTLGKKRLFLSLSYQYYKFESADGLGLNSLNAVLSHEPEFGQCYGAPADNGYANDCVGGQPRYVHSVVSTSNQISLKMNQVTVTGTYGVTDNLDVSLTVPVLNVRMAVSSSATIYNVGAASYTRDNVMNPAPTDFAPCDQLHVFANTNDPTACLNGSFSNANSVTGVGDFNLRLKQRVSRGEKSSFAVGSEFRIPTGDALNFLGAGTWGVRPFGIYTSQFKALSPHANVSFLINGQSLLAGDVTSAIVTKAHLPDVVSYSAGVDATLHHRLGVAVDFLGQSLLGASKVSAATYPAYTDANPLFAGKSGYVIPALPTTTTSTVTVTLASVAAGIKVSPTNHLVVTANGLFRLNNAGLRAAPVPLFGVAYSF